jgi:hypothetical protein
MGVADADHDDVFCGQAVQHEDRDASVGSCRIGGTTLA